MKCDELKEVEYPIEWGLYYDKKEVDAAIAELKKKLMPCLNGDCILTCEVVEKYGKENAELKCELKDIADDRNEFKKLYSEQTEKLCIEKTNVDTLEQAWRQSQRALWLARAERADDKARIFYFAETCGVDLNIDGYSNKEKGHTRMRTARWWRLTWLKVERKCREKAEQYK